MLEEEKRVAVAAVLKACHVTRKVQKDLVESEKAIKDDKSPVTVADYAAQALISKLIFTHFPQYTLVGEEDAKDLRSDSQTPLRQKITQLANWSLALPSPGDQDPWASVGSSALPESAWLDAIDKGDASETATGRVWALDPIDGTKGFLRKGQYAVCLALLEHGKPVLGVMGCPNLPVKIGDTEGEKGVLFVAVKGEGAFQRSLTSPELSPINMNLVKSLGEASFCESVEAGHSDQSTNAKIASLLGIIKPPVRMDSQAKYCSIARGDGDVYLRLPVRADYQEKIWDHASGVLLVEEAGGKVTDCDGKDLDFSVGRTLRDNKGIVAAHKDLHDKVVAAVKEARSSAQV